MRNHIVVVCLSLVWMLGGCRTDGLSDPVPAGDADVWGIRINHQAVLLSLQAPYDTLQLSVAARNVFGSIIVPKVDAQFRTSSRNLAIDSNGVIHAISTTNEAWIIAEVTFNRIQFRDSVRVRIQAAAPTVIPERLSIAIDSSSLAARGITLLTLIVPQDLAVSAVVTGADNQRISNAYIRYWVSDPTIAVIQPNTGALYGLMPGKNVWVYAGSTIFGVTLIDSVQVRITNPLFVSIGVHSAYVGSSTEPTFRFVPSLIRMNIGGTVVFNPYDNDTTQYDIQFDSPELAGPPDLIGMSQFNAFLFGPPMSGNVEASTSRPSFAAGRSFWQPGRYRYWSDRLKIEGIIIVEEIPGSL